MRAALTVAGLEVELVVRSTAVEAIVSRRYAPFLGAVQAPACSLVLEEAHTSDETPFAMMAAGPDRHEFDVVLSGADLPAGVKIGGSWARIRTAATAGSIDRALHVVFALLAADHDAVLFEAGGAILGRSAHVYTGGSEPWRATLAEHAGRRPMLSSSCVAVRLLDGRWTAAATPFGPGPQGSPRQAALTQLWVPQSGPFARRCATPGREAAVVLDAALVPSRDPEVRAAAERRVRQLLNAVPCSELPGLAPAQQWAEMSRRARRSGAPAALPLG